MGTAMDDAAEAYTIPEFCLRNRISRALYYKLPPESRPREMRPTESKVLISKEAAAEWRRKLEAANTGSAAA
jgi:hypothetical protein